MPAPLPEDVRARLRSAVIERVLPRFGGNPKVQQSAAARALDVQPSSINRLVNHGAGGSIEMIEKVEKLLNDPPGTILGYTNGAAKAPRFRDLPGFEEVLSEAERRARDNKIQLTRKDLEFAGDYRLSPPPKRLTPDLLVQLALALAPDAPPPKVRATRKK